MNSSDLNLSNVNFSGGFEYEGSSFVTSPYDDNDALGYTKLDFSGDGCINFASLEAYIPEHLDESTKVVVAFPGWWDEASSPTGKVNFDKTLLWKQPNLDNNTIYIVPNKGNGLDYDYQNTVCASIDQLTEVIPANWNNVTVAGVSNGGGKAWNTALASCREDYSFNVSKLAIGDSYHIEKGGYDTPSSTDDYALFAEKGVKLVVVTNDDSNSENCNKDCVKMLRKYMTAGGDTLYIEYDSDHDSKCIDPYEKNLLAWINGDGELDESFVNDEKVKFWISDKDELTGELVLDEDGLAKLKELSYEDFTAIKNDLINYTDVVSMDYEFVNLNIDKLLDLVDRCNILSLDKVTIETGGMLTFAKANEYFNNYVGASQNFLSELSSTYNFILQIADSMNNLDSSLAETIDLNSYIKNLPSYNGLIGINLTPIDEFYKNFSMLDLATIPISKDVKITTDMLFDVLSDRHIMRASLIEDIRDTTRIRDNLENFIAASKDILKGAALDLMRSKLMEYSSVCDSKIKYAENLMETMYNSFMELLNYMEDYDMLDTSMIPEVESQINSVQTQINNLEQDLMSLQHMHGQPIYGTDENGELIQIGTVDNSAQIAAVSAQIAELEIVLAELNYFKNKLEGLKSKDQSIADNMGNIDKSNDLVNDNDSKYSVLDGVRDVESGEAGNGILPGEPRYNYLKERGLSNEEIDEVQARVNNG